MYELIDLPTSRDERGAVTYLEANDDVPFEIKRVYYLHDLTGERRGEHAHRELKQVMIAAHGAFTVELDDGCQREAVRLDDPTVGLYVAPKLWRDIDEFDDDAVCLVLASHRYDEDDYIRDYETFQQFARETDEG